MATDTVKLTKTQRIGFAIESTTGTAATLSAGTAAALVIDPSITPDRQGIKIPRMGFGSSRFLPGAAKGTGKFSDYMTGLGTTGSDGVHSDFLLACGAVNDSGTYKFTSAPGGTATYAHYLDGLLHQLVGAMGNCIFTLRPGEPVLREFSWQGAYGGVVDTAIPTPVTDPTLVAPVLSAATITIGGAAYCWDELKLDLGNQLIYRPNAAATGGIKSAWITDRISTLTVSPEAVSVATKDWGGLFDDGETAEFSAAIGAGGDNNSFTIAATLALSKYPGLVDGNGRVCNDLAFEVVNESLTIALT